MKRKKMLLKQEKQRKTRLKKNKISKGFVDDIKAFLEFFILKILLIPRGIL